MLRLASNNVELTGVLVGNVTAAYTRDGAALVNFSPPVTWTEVSAGTARGLYRMSIPDAAFVAGVDWVMVSVYTTASHVYYEKFFLTTDVRQTGDTFAQGATAATAIAAIQTDTNDLQARLPAALVGGRMTSDVAGWNGTVVPAPDTAGYPKVTIKDGAGAGEINLTAGVVDTVGAVSGNVAGNVGGTVGSVSGAVASVTGNVGGNVTGSVGSVAGNVVGSVGSVAGNVVGSVGSVAGAVVGSVGSVAGNVVGSVDSVTDPVTVGTLAADTVTAAALAADAGTEISAAVWDRLTSAIVAAGSIGALLKGAVPIRLTKNVAFTNFVFFMTDSADHVSAKAGLTVSAERSIDGGAFAACANAVTEMSVGFYKLNLAATDLNGNCIAFRFTATGADVTPITVITQTA